jgi:hypothetical protein
MVNHVGQKDDVDWEFFARYGIGKPKRVNASTLAHATQTVLRSFSVQLADLKTRQESNRLATEECLKVVLAWQAQGEDEFKRQLLTYADAGKLIREKFAREVMAEAGAHLQEIASGLYGLLEKIAGPQYTKAKPRLRQPRKKKDA